MKEFAAFVLAVLLFVGGLVAGGMALNNHSVHVACLRATEQAGVESKVAGVLSPDCFVKVGGKWIPAERWRGDEVG